MRLRKPPAPPRADGVPLCLLAGKCIEVWAPGVKGDGSPYVAWRNYSNAIKLWRQRNGIGVWEHDRMPETLMRGGAPWSFAYLAATNPELLARVFAHRGLPPDWRPEPAPEEWLEAAGKWPG